MLTQTQLATPGGSLNIAQGPNNGPLLILFHGFTNRWQMFLPILPALLPHWHVVAFDHRGHGGSSRLPEGQAYNAHTFYEDAEAVFDAFVPDGKVATLLGHSMGGSMALWLAANHPKRVLAVATGDTSLDIPKHIETMNNRRNGKLFALRRRMASLPVEDLLRRGMPLASAEELHCLDPRVMDKHAVSQVGDFFEGIRSFRLDDFRCPVLLTQANPAKGGILQDDEIPPDLPAHPLITLLRFDLGHDLQIEQGPDSPFFQAAISFLMAQRAQPGAQS